MERIVIDDIEAEAFERLKQRAAIHGKSLERLSRDLLLAEAARPIPADRPKLLAELDRIRAMTSPREAGKVYPTAEELIREGRDSR